MQQDPPKQAIPKSKANKLEQDLQRQFAELRRKKLAKTGLPSGPATPKQDSNTVKSSVQRAKGDATVKAKSTVSGRKARTERRKLARAKKQTSSTSAAVVSPIENVSTKKGIDGTPSSEGNEKKGSKPVPKAMKKSKRKVPTNVTDLILETLKVRKYQSDKPNSNETLMDLKNQSSASERPEPEATVTANEALETTSTRSMKRKPSSEASPGSKASQAPRKTLTASTKRKPPSLKAPSGTTARKKADIKAVNAGDLVLKGKSAQMSG